MVQMANPKINKLGKKQNKKKSKNYLEFENPALQN